MIKRLIMTIRKSSNSGIFHNSREDIVTLGKAMNILIDKVNELVDANNTLVDKVKELEGRSNG